MISTVAAIIVGSLVAAVLAAWWFTRSVAKKVEASLPPKGQFTDVPGGRIHWIEKGEGHPVVMIHGLAGSHANFTYAMLDKLAEKGYRAIAIDRPGCGWSERDGDEQARIPNQAAMIAAWLEAEGIENALLVGHSLGGAVSLALAVSHPDRVSGLALISALVRAPEAPSDAFAGINIANPGIRKFVAHTIATPMAIRTGEKTLSIVFGPDAAPADFRTRGGGLLGLRPRAFYAAATDMHAVEKDMDSITDRIGEIEVPVGMFYGEDDLILVAPEQIAALREKLPNAVIEAVPNHGHMPLVIIPDEVTGFVQRMAEKSFR
ncbi:alpha/beta fold hydrolase [Maricaulis parjimensis]|uniref:alpha/beta fold hydrolase n=1 Tax=Maricaulis parjimensis TaxID=144023 RepID=UPI001939506E|nr:alpha/beta hydrolase [Maricaulis parjimensis]